MSSEHFSVPNINCGHCVAKVERILGEIPGVTSVSASSTDKEVDVEYAPPATRDQMAAALTEWGYPPAE
jgi:copper chaperone